MANTVEPVPGARARLLADDGAVLLADDGAELLAAPQATHELTVEFVSSTSTTVEFMP